MLDRLDIASLRQREDHAANQGFMGGMLLGVLLGVVLTLVFAPRRGEETRAAMAHKAVEVKDKAVHRMDRTAPGIDRDEWETGQFGTDVAIEREIGVPTGAAAQG